MKLGTKNVIGLKVGTVNITRAYLGSTLVWEAGGEPPAVECGGPSVYGDSGWQTVGPLTAQVGRRFTVGANDITVCALRFYSAGGGTETLRLWRVSDASLLASASVTSTGGWGETSITPIVLTAGLEYMVSSYAAGAGRLNSRNPTAYITDPAVTYGNSYFIEGAGLPTTVSGQVYAGVAIRTQAPASGYRFYRLNVTANNGRSTTNVAELGLRASTGGSSVATSGAASASNSFDLTTWAPSKAFDQQPATAWATTAPVVAAWLMYDFGSAAEREIVQYALQARADANDGTPKDWTLEGSNDLATWTTLHTVTGETGWANGEQRVFTA